MTSRNRLLFNFCKNRMENHAVFILRSFLDKRLFPPCFLPLAGSLPAGRLRLYPQSLKNGRSQFRRGK
nr:MAG TPA: hypothetical protein [Caudoviricetes sp.]